MAREMAEQPARLHALAARADEILAIVRDVLPEPMHGQTIVARGSSDHAAMYGRYLLEVASGMPVSLAAPSLHTLYRASVDYRGQLVLAVSQSGQTPEIVQTLRHLCAGGGHGVAVTNDSASELARTARATIELGVGEELAVPATKTVTAQMLVFALVARALGPVGFSEAQLACVGDWVAAALADAERAEAAAARLVGCTRLVVVARGYLYGAALESALKVKETCGLLADGYSSADLRHGPIAAVTPEVPVIALSAPGPAQDDVAELVGSLRARGVTVITVGCAAGDDVPLPSGVPEALAPVVAVVRGQQIARALALALGREPDAPEGLSKVTIT